MFKLVSIAWVLSFCLISCSAKAFQDSWTTGAIATTKQQISSAPTREAKVQIFERFKKLMDQRITTLPNISKLPANDPRVIEDASLNEFDGYLYLMKFPVLDQKNCQKSLSKIYLSVGDEASGRKIPMEAKEALEILGAICKDI